MLQASPQQGSQLWSFLLTMPPPTDSPSAANFPKAVPQASWPLPGAESCLVAGAKNQAQQSSAADATIVC